MLKADVSAQTLVKIGFGVEKRLKEGDVVGNHESRLKPSTVRMHFELQVNLVVAEDSVAQSALLGNITMSKMPIVHQPPNPYMLWPIVEDLDVGNIVTPYTKSNKVNLLLYIIQCKDHSLWHRYIFWQHRERNCTGKHLKRLLSANKLIKQL